MDAARFGRLARSLSIAGTRRSVARALAGFGFGAAFGAARPYDALAKTCGPCRTKKKGKCKKKRQNGTPCPGGQCFNGACNPGCCGDGCAARCAADEVCVDPVAQQCGPACDDACFDRTGCGCARVFNSEAEYCNVNPDLEAACASPECDSHADCASDQFCTVLFCGNRCVSACPG